jgi:hypothetical protein
MWSFFTDVKNLTLLLRLNKLLLGTYLECVYALFCVGINIKNIPKAEEGTMDFDYYHKWLEERRRLEKSCEEYTIRPDEMGRKRKKSPVSFGT